jgi:ABC-type lipoprotein release transport system permease subunit
MIIKIAWRNVWRNGLRSGVVIASIAMGIWAGLFVISVSSGLNEQRTKDALNSYLSHIQIHNPEFIKDNNVEFRINDMDPLRNILRGNPDVKAFSERVVLSGMVSSSAGGFGARITGVNPEQEKSVSTMHEKVLEGGYFEGIKRNPVFLGKKLAEKLKVGLRKKIVLTFQKDNGDIITAAFRVVGIYKTANAKADEMNVFVRSSDINRLLEENAGYHEVAIISNNLAEIDTISGSLGAALPNLSVRSWKEISPDLGYADEMMMQMLYIIIGIILMALSFGIINTMLMAVLERKRELGMLMSVGMNKTKVFFMVVIETVFISMVGGPIGVLLGYLTVVHFGKAGIDLSIIGKGLEEFGVSTTIYPYLESSFYLNVTIMVIIAAILSSIYPAIKALQLKPAEAVRAL